MRIVIRFLVVILISASTVSNTTCQEADSLSVHFVKKRPLKNGSIELMELTMDSLLIYKGTYKSFDPPTRHGRFYFFSKKGYLEATGVYVEDVPHGTWVHYNEAMDTVKVVDYGSVWDYMENEAQNYIIDSTIFTKLKRKYKETMNDDGTFHLVNDMPKFEGKNTLESFDRYIQEHLQYPPYSARKGATGNVIIQFMVDTKGKVRNPQIVNKASSDLNIEALRILLKAPDWKPGSQAGIPVNVLFTWVFRFTYDRLLEEDILWIYKKSMLEEMPRFNGGDAATTFRRYIAQNLRYPERAAENGIQGRVVVGFTVQTDGSISDIHIVKSEDPDLDAEAIRVVRSSPPWIPGQVNGEFVSTILTFPMNFILN